MGAEYLQCPYCIPFEGGLGKKVPRSVGLFKIKQLHNFILLLECQRCKGVFKLRMAGSLLKWKDLSSAEKGQFNINNWQKKRMKSQGGKNDGRN